MTHSTEHKHDSPRDLSPLAARLVLKRLRDDRGPLFDDVIHREDVLRRTDLGDLPNYRTHKHTLYGRQEGRRWPPTAPRSRSAPASACRSIGP